MHTGRQSVVVFSFGMVRVVSEMIVMAAANPDIVITAAVSRSRAVGFMLIDYLKRI
jgi:hypothetical protein